MKKPFYITTTLPYVNAEPHMGHALEFIRADVIARMKRLQGFDVCFNTGTDEHGQKLFEAAAKAGKPVQQYVDENAQVFKNILPLLGVSNTRFIRTTDPAHIHTVEEIWKKVYKNGYIYKKNYRSKYCVNCEEAKTDSELVNGRCPIHQNRDLEIREEENYFFAFSKFGEKLLALYDSGAFSVVPDSRFNEVKEFVKRGLIDFSISRLASKMSWGIPVPGDPEHVIYVWFDALPNYISTVGWPTDMDTFKTYWQNGTPVQYCGKDNTRFQSVMWQAMLLAADVPSTHTVVVNGFVTAEGGVKMSKSLGNGVDPLDVVREYDVITNGLGAEVLRYFVCREISSFEDSPFTVERVKSAYNTHLANGLGNLVSRIMKMATTHGVTLTPEQKNFVFYTPENSVLADFDITKAISDIWMGETSVGSINESIQIKAPFKEIKVNPDKAKKDIADMLYGLFKISKMLEIYMPQTAMNIQQMILSNTMPEKPLFLRKD